MVLTGKKVLITGAAKRIGRACALSLADCGAEIILHYNTSEEEALKTAEAIRKKGADCHLVKGDLFYEDSTERVFREAAEKAGYLDILINSASVFPAGNFAESDWEDYLNSSRTNALAPLLLSRLFSGQKNSKGCIINFLDTRMQDYDREHFPYHLSKRMLLSATRALALELAPSIRVNGIAPGLILPPPGMDESYLQERKSSNPLSCIGTLQQITDSVCFLLKNDFVTGQIIYVDGGRHLHGKVYT